MNTKPFISIIGAGNVGWHLASVLHSAGYLIEEIYSRDPEKSLQSALRFEHCIATQSLDFSQSRSKVFIITVSDNAIATVSEQLILPVSAIVLHTSGTASIDHLQKHNNCGVFYPLQSISKHVEIDWKVVPILIEAKQETDWPVILQIASDVSDSVYRINSEQRKFIHLAAVFSNNFVNHLFAISEQLLAEKQIPFSLLEGLIKQTVDKAFANTAKASQTGPAVRNDTQTINAQLQMLANMQSQQLVYDSMTKSILEMYNSK